MKVKPVAEELFGYLMDTVQGAKFEGLAKKLCAFEYDETFTPLGGMHDGGADGLISSYVQQGNKPGTFAQFSVTESAKAKTKLTETIAALRKAGREPKVLIYCTSASIPKQDIVQQQIFDSLNVLIAIRDRERILQIVNGDLEANRAFYETLSPEITAIVQAKAPMSGAVNEFVGDPTVFVFLNHELRDRTSKHLLLNRVTDGLIYWALRDTDPDCTPKKLLSRPEIATAIQDVFPTAKTLLLPRLAERLPDLAKKTAAGVERLRYYRDNDSFCLPFDMRKELAAESAALMHEQDAFKGSIEQRLKASGEQLSPIEIANIVALAFHTVHRHFVEQGLLLAAFLEKKTDKLLRDQVVEDEMLKVIALKHASPVAPGHAALALQALRGIFYDPTSDERKYLTYLCRTSLLCTTLNVSPRLLEYFNQMGGNYRLFVGTDLLVKAISEAYLDESQQQVTNILRVMSKLGAKLLLSESTLIELFTHLHGVDLEFRNHYQPIEQYIKERDIPECNRILIRTYLYAHRLDKGPKTWGEFVNTLVDTTELRSKSEKGKQQLKGLLTQKFKMAFVSLDDLTSGTSKAAVEKLAAQLQSQRGEKHQDLSYNDALMAHAVYAQRSRHDESAVYDGFGVRTWWLTKETRVLSLTAELVRQNGVPYIMRPEFLLNFITLAPKAAEVRDKYSDLLPTTAGLQLGQHLDASVMHTLLADAAEWAKQRPERVGVMISEKVTRLKFDRLKRYPHNVA